MVALDAGRQITRFGNVHYRQILPVKVRPRRHLRRCDLLEVEVMVEGVRLQKTVEAGVRLQTVEARHRQVEVRLGYML